MTGKGNPIRRSITGESLSFPTLLLSDAARISHWVRTFAAREHTREYDTRHETWGEGVRIVEWRCGLKSVGLFPSLLLSFV